MLVHRWPNVFPIELLRSATRRYSPPDIPLRDDVPAAYKQVDRNCSPERYGNSGPVRPAGNARAAECDRTISNSFDGRVPYLPGLGDIKRIGKNDSVKIRSLADAEREHILQTLRQTDWVVGGPHSAAARFEVTCIYASLQNAPPRYFASAI